MAALAPSPSALSSLAGPSFSSSAPGSSSQEPTSSCSCAIPSTNWKRCGSKLSLRSSFKGDVRAFSEPTALRSSRAFKLNVVAKAGNVAQDQFEDEVLKAEVPVLVDFWSTWCGPCRLVVPAVDWAAKEYAGKLKVVKVETDASPELVEKYKVYGLPTIVLFKDGQVVEGSHREGAFTQAKLKEYIQSFL